MFIPPSWLNEPNSARIKKNSAPSARKTFHAGFSLLNISQNER